MKRTYIFILSLLSLSVFALPAIANNEGDHHEKKAIHYDPFIQLMIDQVSFMQGRFMSLADAIPENKYSWRPSESVRTTAEQLAHTIGAAYGIPSMMGAEMPSHITMEIEKTLTGKDEILKNLNASFESAKKFLENYNTANFEEIVETPFGKFSQRNMILILNNHYHEHLGQLIVYARSNGVVPPWSQEQSNNEE